MSFLGSYSHIFKTFLTFVFNVAPDKKSSHSKTNSIETKTKHFQNIKH